MTEALDTLPKGNTPNLELLANVVPTVDDRNEASLLVTDALVDFHAGSDSDLVNGLYNNGGDEKAGVLKGVQQIVGQAKYFNGSEAGPVHTPDGLGAWKDAIKLSEALFYTGTQIQVLEAEVDKIQDAEPYDDPEKEEARQRVAADQLARLREAIDASIDLRAKGDQMRVDKLAGKKGADYVMPTMVVPTQKLRVLEGKGDSHH